MAIGIENVQKIGMDFICLCKSSQSIIKNRTLSFNRENSLNDGVISDELVALCGDQRLIRMVRYANTEDGQTYNFSQLLWMVKLVLVSSHTYIFFDGRSKSPMMYSKINLKKKILGYLRVGS